MSAALLSDSDTSHTTPRASVYRRVQADNLTGGPSSGHSDHEFGAIVESSQLRELYVPDAKIPLASTQPRPDQAKDKENIPLALGRLSRYKEGWSSNLDMQKFTSGHSRTSLSRTQSAPMFDHIKYDYTDEDISFLGPKQDDAFLILPDEVIVEPVLALQEQLNIAMKEVEGMKLEIQQLRVELANRPAALEGVPAGPSLVFQTSSGHTDSVFDNDTISHSQDRAVVLSNPAGRRSLNADCVTTEFPRLHETRRTASPLPTPDEPGVASAFLRGQMSTPLIVSSANTASKIVRQGPAESGTNLDSRRQSEPLSSCLQSTRGNPGLSVVTTASNYDHLSFFPGASNTPRTDTFSETCIEDSRIWTKTPSTVSIADSTFETESMQEWSDQVNYRRILDRNAEMNWSAIVERIVQNNDQQASVALQQKLKMAPTDQKPAIVDAIVDQAYPLMINRFGNFLIQRCFEHGSSEQIQKIAEAIVGNVLILSKDAFGCHVVQKAFDNVSDAYKAAFVDELLKDITNTVTHRYACHVWQKLFEVRWLDETPEIMSHVNSELQGKWADVAMGETGSLVVQNIFENCLESERLPCTQEILASVHTIVRGQWGNWVIQHIIEHGSESDKEAALDVVMKNAVDYSVDQYASKVIEKAIKSGDPWILKRYLSAITDVSESDRGRPRVPLIDIASDQYGNYLIQYLLTNGSSEQKSIVSAHIRKHMVSMRGSRYGAKVAFTVERMRQGSHYDDRGARDYRISHSGRGRGSAYHGPSTKHNYRTSRE